MPPSFNWTGPLTTNQLIGVQILSGVPIFFMTREMIYKEIHLAAKIFAGCILAALATAALYTNGILK